MRKLRVQAQWDRANRFGIWGIFGFLKTLVAGIFLYLSVSWAAAQGNAKNVLVLFSFSDRADYVGLNILKSELRAGIPFPLNFNVEYLEGRRLDDKGYEEALVRTLGHTYRRAKLDLVLIQSYTGLQFAIRHRDELFADVPIIFLDIDPDQIRGQKMPPGVTGVTARAGVGETIDLALNLHPKTTTVAVIISNSTPDRYFLARIQAELRRYQNKISEVDFVGLPLGEFREKIAALPMQTVVLFDLAPQESVQPAIGVSETLEWIAQRLPTYGIFWGDVNNHGGIGSVNYLWNPELALVAKEATRVLSGERPENISILNYADLRPIVDWRELQRWHIPESALPAGSVILYREPTFWQRYRRYIIPVIALIVAQALLIAALLWLRARKQKAEAVLRESEERFRTMADNTPSMIWMCDRRGKITYLNNELLEFLGPDSDAYGDSWINYAHPDDVNRVLDMSSRALEARKPFSKQSRVRRWDGVYRWLFEVATPRMNGDGSFAGYIGSAVDVTDQKLAQQALEKLSGQLIEAQENERRRIARDLHDDICQRLALLSMELDQANRSANESTETTRQRLKEIRQHCAEIAGDVQSLSHELHSSRLDYLGVVAAIRGFCHEFSMQHEVGIEFTERDVPADLPRDIALCLFRVAQEALHNAVKYSGVSHYAVELTGTAEEIKLVVSDSGRGFDVKAAKQNRGLGLVSMQERVHMVHGCFYVESEPGEGTKILAVVPLVGKDHKPFQDGAANGEETMSEVV